MASVSYYRKEAERCRELAAGSPDTEAAKRWRTIAADYDNLADAFDAHPAATTRTVMQQQSMQQQQSKSEPEDKT
jgi:TorA maturation chaperone TorD